MCCQLHTLTSRKPTPQVTTSSNHTIKFPLKRKATFLKVKWRFIFLLQQHTEFKSKLDLWWSRSLTQNFFLEAKAANNTRPSHQSHVRLLPPLNDDSLRMQYLCSAMPVSRPPSQSLTHIPKFLPLCVFLRFRPPVGSSALADAHGKRSVGHLNLLPPQESSS